MGLYDYNARYYDPYLNRFLSPDSIIPDPANPQSLNRYTYVLNNPLKYTDPTGHKECLDDECNWSIHPVSDKLMLGGHKIEEQAGMLSIYYGIQETPWSQISDEHRKILRQGGWDSTTYTDEFITGNAEDVAGTARDPAVWIVGIVSIAKLAPTAREVVAYLGTLCVSNPICATLIGNSVNDPDGDPLPPGWNENWELEYGVRGNTPHWWDELGGEWRWHAVDQWHSRGHWDYNPWTHWNSPWQNIYPGGGSIP